MKKNVLYVAYTGLLEPLGQSQVLAYLTRLSSDYNFILVTFEKETDLKNTAEVQRLEALCSQYNIIWLPKKYHKKPRLLATAFDIITMLNLTFKLVRKHNIKLIHCRSYIPSIAVNIASRITKTPFIFDMRALWLEEMIEGKRLRRDSITYKALNRVKGYLLKDAASVVSLTKVAIPYLKSNYQGLEKQNFEVIPTCADLEKFASFVKPYKNDTDITYGTMGTVISSRFRGDWLFKLFAVQFQLNPETKFKIVSRDHTADINRIKDSVALGNANFELTSSAPGQIIDKIKDIDVAVILFTPGLSTLGTSPTRIAEFLACGIPVMVNRGIGDTADLVELSGVGVVVEDGSEEALLSSLKKMSEFLTEPDYQTRCKNAAKEIFSADAGADKYRELYERCIK